MAAPILFRLQPEQRISLELCCSHKKFIRTGRNGGIRCTYQKYVLLYKIQKCICIDNSEIRNCQEMAVRFQKQDGVLDDFKNTNGALDDLSTRRKMMKVVMFMIFLCVSITGCPTRVSARRRLTCNASHHTTFC